MSLAAVIKISNFKENIKPSIDSVWESRGRIKELHIIDQSYDENKQYYDTFDEDIKKLENIRVFMGPVLDIKQIDTDYIVEIPPSCRVKLAGIDLLQKRTKVSTQWETHFGLETHIRLDNSNSFLDNIVYGYLLISAFLFLCWSKFEFGKMFRSTDVRMTAIIRKGKHKYIACRPGVFTRYFNNPETAAMIPTEDCDISSITPTNNKGFDFIHQHLAQDSQLTSRRFYFPKWWFILYAIYWLYNLVVVIVVYRILTLQIPITHIWISWPILSLFILWGFNWIIIIYASSRYYTFDWQFPLSFLAPLYALSWPVVLAYAKFVRYKK